MTVVLVHVHTKPDRPCVGKEERDKRHELAHARPIDGEYLGCRESLLPWARKRGPQPKDRSQVGHIEPHPRLSWYGDSEVRDRNQGTRMDYAGRSRRFFPVTDRCRPMANWKENLMLWTIAVILTILWLLGLVSSYTMGGFIHLLLVLAIVVVLVRVIQGRRLV